MPAIASRAGWSFIASWVFAGLLGLSGCATPPPSSHDPHATTRQRIVGAAERMVGTPYVLGGESPGGVDCSGLVQMVFILMGIYLPRDASLQAAEGDVVELLDLCEPGDLAFFDNAEGRITHVGIILTRSEDDDLRIAHSSGRVRIDKLDTQGIYNAEEARYTHKLRMVRRVL